MKYTLNSADIFSFANRFGIRTREKGNEIKFETCPYCKSSSGDKWTFSINSVTGAFCCPRASCGEHGHFVELARDFDFSLEGIEQGDYTMLPKVKLISTSIAENYLFSRGIRKEITRLYNVTTDPDDDNKLIFPFYRSRPEDADGVQYEPKMDCVKYRFIDPSKTKDGAKEKFHPKCRLILFGMNHCDIARSRTLIITEGQIDSLSIASAGIPNAVSVPNGARGFSWVEHCREFVQQFDSIVVFGDCERGGITLVSEIREMFPDMKIRVPRMKDYLGEKDANDILRSFGENALRKAVENAEAFKPATIKEMADVQKVDLSDVPHFMTYLPKLDNALTGLYEGQFIVLTGKAGAGKSTFASQIATAALWQGWNTLIYSGELADYEVKRWIDFQLAGSEAIKKKVGVSSANYYLPDEYEKQLSAWYRHRLYIIDNNAVDNSDDADIVAEAKAAVRTYDVRFIIFDNLMTAVESGEDVYNNQSKFAKRLKALARELHVVVLLVAHPRKTKSKQLDNDEVSGSSNVTNLADAVIALDSAVKTKDDGEKVNQTLLAVRKNRATGDLLQGDDRIQLRHSKKSKRIYQIGENGRINPFPFNAEAAKEEETVLPF